MLHNDPVPPLMNKWSGRCDARALIFFCYTVNNTLSFQSLVTATILVADMEAAEATRPGP